MQEKSESTLKTYFFSLIEAHTCNQHSQSILDHLALSTQQAEEHTKLLHFKKKRITEITCTLRESTDCFNINPELYDYLKQKANLPKGRRERDMSQHLTTLPNIVVADLSWAYDYLTEIKDESIKEMEELQINHKKGIEALETMLKKYEQKLEKKEQNLEKALSEMKNTRRYL